MVRRRKPVIGIMGGHRASASVIEMAHELGRLVAQRGWILLNGGRNTGVMAASARGAREAGGMVVGILPGHTDHGASPDLDIVIPTGFGEGRNLINIHASDVVIACPGSLGTLSEVVFALKFHKPVILLGFDPGSALDQYRRTGQLREARDPSDAVCQAGAWLERTDGKHE